MIGFDLTAPLLAVLALGAAHGINPGMGWLFAVALGLQEQRGRAVWRALPPLALGHALAIAAVLAVAAAAGVVAPPAVLKWVVAASLIGFGAYRLLRARHPRFGGMRVGFRDLTVWSFLMASAHGAGLMVLPLVLSDDPRPEAAAPAPAHAQDLHTAHAHATFAAKPNGPSGEGPPHAQHTLAAGMDAHAGGALATMLHTAGYLLVTGLIAVIVYARLGLRLLGRLWLNVDRVWAGALVLTGILTAST